MKAKHTVLFVIWIFLSLSAFAQNEALLSKIIKQAQASDSDSLVLIEKEQILYENYFSKNQEIRNVQSITKSLCGLAIGILIDEGKIKSLDTPMSQFLPEWSHHPQKSKITLRMIMNHTSGITDMSLPRFPNYDDMVQAARDVALTFIPGSRFDYSSAGTALLQPVITQLAGESVESFMNRKIFHPLGITDARWSRDATAREVTSGGAWLTTADLIRLGQLILNKGRNGNTIVISETSLQLLLTKSQPYANYGLLFWLDQPAKSKNKNDYSIYRLDGYGGQYVIIYPEKKLIAVRTRDHRRLDQNHLAEQMFFELRDWIPLWE